MANPPKRVSVFVDGFNLYHALITSRHKFLPGQPNQPIYEKPYAKYRWLNLRALASQFIGRDEILNQIHYFTAYIPWDQQAQARHAVYVAALHSVGVSTVLGNFQKKDKRCLAQCRQTFQTYEEKMTDVNIAITLMKSCVKDEHDIAFIISGDNDLKPALETAISLYPNKEIKILLPIEAKAKSMHQWGRDNNVSCIRINENHLANSQLPTPIHYNGRILTKPPSWS